jgi:hypothetical protein
VADTYCMDLQRKHLEEAQREGLLHQDQIDPLWTFLNQQPDEVARFRGSHILFYLGGLLAIGAMSLFMTLGWQSFGGMGIFIIALIYGIGACAVSDWMLWHKRQPVPAGLLATLAVTMVPLAIYGLQDYLGMWDSGLTYHDFHAYIDSRWMIMELGTLVGGLLLFWRYRLPFMMMPIAVTLWYMSMDLTPYLFHDMDYDWVQRQRVSIVVGLLMLIGAFILDLRTRHIRDYAWWIYLFGLMAFWGGLSLQHSGNEWAKFGYCLINLALITFGGMIGRRVFAVFGGLGVSGYLGYLSWDLFQDSLLFPFVLTLIGFALIGAGMYWQKFENRFQQRLEQHLPAAFRRLLEHR